MNTISTTAAIALLCLAVIAIAAVFLHQRHRSHRLQSRFGAEYRRTLEELGSKTKAEAELEARERRVRRLKIVALNAADAARFASRWKTVQARFVDDPNGAVSEAGQLVHELMSARGFPAGDFNRRAADISVDHPGVVPNYRAAQDIAVRNERGEATTEELRRAVTHYRALFDELLEERELARKTGFTHHLKVQ
jgi:hypothetical protein